MSKRLIRVGSTKIYPALNGLLTHEINAVLENGKTYFGRLLSFTPDSFKLTDFRDHTHDIQLRDVYEIVFDEAQKRTVK
ncbi:hypothetical protein FEN17_17850 [Dyadobacter luticola]|uniref:Uncharacterized protein n=1 Tax=Dyadobacter luticola TaxID=1979387 RepID=A0A5R9KYW6_9BACT|nr:hypothetical protein FEN17_17850 [Dyadobacter luticola]